MASSDRTPSTTIAPNRHEVEPGSSEEWRASALVEMSGEDWDQVVASYRCLSGQDVWRGYMKEVYCRLARRWFEGAPPGPRLKTDLFEEAICEEHPMAEFPQRSVGADGSIAVAARASSNLRRFGHYRLVVGDLRRSPFRPGALGSILSGSSLDHFVNEEELVAGLAEVAGGLCPGGILILTLDNPSNPAIWLRNRLPYRVLRRVGLVPYFVGRTWSAGQARKALESLGLEVSSETAIAHLPRAPAMWLESLSRRGRGERLGRLLLRIYLTFEYLERLPTRYLTGYYVAVRARRPGGTDTSGGGPGGELSRDAGEPVAV